MATEIAGFGRTIGLAALLSLIPFIILYMRRPKPKEQLIPSLMFIVKDQQKVKRFSFFRTLMANLIFWLQLFALIGISITVASPFIKIPYDVTLENTVIVLDASASMQTKDSSGVARFQKALDTARKSLSGKNSIVLAESTPLIVLEDEDTEIAHDVLNKITPKATATNLGDALLLAKDILGDKPGRIVVISDFAATEGPDVKVVKTAVSSQEKIIDFVDVSSNANNVGIVRLEPGKYTTKIYIKNFNNIEKIVSLKIYKNDKEVSSSGAIKIYPKSIESFVFDTIDGITKVELLPHDDLAVDDFAYIAPPPKIRFKVLLITNEKNSNLEYALSSAKDIGLNVVNPPVLTINTKKEKIAPFSHDVIIVYNVNNINKKDGLLPGTFSDLRDYAEKGGNLVIAAQPDLKSFNTEGLLNVELKNIVQKPSKVCVDVVNAVTKQFQKERCFTTVSSYYPTEPKKGAIAFASADDKSSLITFSQNKKGNVVYYGIIDEFSDFKTLPSYPVFWDNLVNMLTGAEDIKDFNHKTGKIIVVSEQKIKTPSSSFTASRIILDEAGIYEYDNKKFAANLLDEKESDVTKSNMEIEKAREELVKKDKRERQLNMEFILLALVFLLMLTEILIVKFRGEL